MLTTISFKFTLTFLETEPTDILKLVQRTRKTRSQRRCLLIITNIVLTTLPFTLLITFYVLTQRPFVNRRQKMIVTGEEGSLIKFLTLLKNVPNSPLFILRKFISLIVFFHVSILYDLVVKPRFLHRLPLSHSRLCRR